MPSIRVRTRRPLTSKIWRSTSPDCPRPKLIVVFVFRGATPILLVQYDREFSQPYHPEVLRSEWSVLASTGGQNWAVISTRLAGLRKTPSAPSSATPVYRKPITRAGKRKKTKRGAILGHPGARRAVAPHIDRTETHSLIRCPNCDGVDLTRRQGQKVTRTRIIEDIPQDTQTEAVEPLKAANIMMKMRQDGTS